MLWGGLYIIFSGVFVFWFNINIFGVILVVFCMDDW